MAADVPADLTGRFTTFVLGHIIHRMKSLNLSAINPAELLPTPEVPASYGPRNEEARRVHEMVKEALDGDDGESYDSVADLIEELQRGIPPQVP